MEPDSVERLLLMQGLLQAEAESLTIDLEIAQLLRDGRRRRERRERRFWITSWRTPERRDEQGHYLNLMVELREEDPRAFKNFTRFEPALFQELVDRIGPRIEKEDTNFRKALTPGLKLAITLRHLASGCSYKDLEYSFRVGPNTISQFLPDVCQAIIDEFQPEVMQVPKTKEEWKAIADQFEARWNFPHTCGALDGKHVAIRCPGKTGTTFYNYKGFYSIVLFGLVDADYKFIWADVGTAGSASDCGIFNKCQLKEGIEQGVIQLPDPEPLAGDDQDTPYFLIGDEAFPLRTWMMKPHARRGLDDEERIYNYRLSRARRLVENAFGILANRFQILLQKCRQKPETVIKLVLAAMNLHNLMRMRYPIHQNRMMDKEDAHHKVIPGPWRKETGEMQQFESHQSQGNTQTQAAKLQRSYLTSWVNGPGAVSWQKDMI